MRNKKFKPENFQVTILPGGLTAFEVNPLVYPSALNNPFYYQQRKMFKEKEDSLRTFPIDSAIMPNGEFVPIEKLNLKHETGKRYKAELLETGKIQIQ